LKALLTQSIELSTKSYVTPLNWYVSLNAELLHTTAMLSKCVLLVADKL
jgi:hypothetical protein